MDAEEVVSNLRNYINGLDQKSINGLEKACLIVERQAKINSPIDDGILRSSITHEVKRIGDSITGVVGSGLEYAPYVHQGTGIYAKDGDGRKTPWVYRNSDGQVIKTVGQHPQPFLLDATVSEATKIINTFKEGF